MLCWTGNTVGECLQFSEFFSARTASNSLNAFGCAAFSRGQAETIRSEATAPDQSQSQHFPKAHSWFPLVLIAGPEHGPQLS